MLGGTEKGVLQVSCRYLSVFRRHKLAGINAIVNGGAVECQLDVGRPGTKEVLHDVHMATPRRHSQSRVEHLRVCLVCTHQALMHTGQVAPLTRVQEVQAVLLGCMR